MIYLILYCGVFEHCDESIDTQLHGLIKSVPTMLLKQNLPAKIESTMDEEEDVTYLSKLLDSELNLSEQLTLKRLKSYAKAIQV